MLFNPYLFSLPCFYSLPLPPPTHPLWPNVSPIFIPTPITRHSCLSRIKAFDGLLQRLGPPPVPIAPLFSRTYLSISVAHLPWASMLTLVEMSPRPLPLPHPLTVQFGLSSLSFQPAAESQTQGRGGQIIFDCCADHTFTVYWRHPRSSFLFKHSWSCHKWCQWHKVL